MANKIEYGIKNVHYALMKEEGGVITYDKPKRVKGARKVKLTAEGDRLDIDADDMIYYSDEANAGYKGDIEFVNVDDDVEVDIFGAIKDEHGGIIENTSAKIKPIALLFEFDGDKSKTRYLLYNVKLGRASVESETSGKSKKIKFKNMPLTATAHPETYNIKFKCREGHPKYDTFFDAVVEIEKQ